MTGLQGFILTRQWRDTPNGIQIELWLSTDQGAVQCIVPRQRAVFFIRQLDAQQQQHFFSNQSFLTLKSLPLRSSTGEAVTAVYCSQQRQLKTIVEQLRAKDITCWEADIRPTERFLMERFITSDILLPDAALSNGYDISSSSSISQSASQSLQHPTIKTRRCQPIEYEPSLSVISLDIETSMDAKELYSIAVYGSDTAIVFMVGDTELPDVPEDMSVIICNTARHCLLQFLSWLEKNDPDIIIGWHVVQFDCWILTKLCQRLGISFTLGRGQQAPHWRVEGQSGSADTGHEGDWVDRQRRYMSVPGRVVLDGIELLRTAFYHFDSFSLQFVANQLLGESKLISHDDRGQAISDLFYSNDLHDRLALAKYNLQDCRLVWDIFKKTNLLEFAIARSRLTGMSLDKAGGSVASFDYAYLPKLHRKGYVAPNLGEMESDIVSPGGYVMQSQPGLYQHVLVLDFKSLYPSIIRTFMIDPYSFWSAQQQSLSADNVVEGFNGAFFSREQSILPELIERLWQARDQAKADNDKPLSQAIKIIMNSFYGVLGSSGCRFFDPRVCSSITLRGHEIIQKSHEFIEQQGYTVIYGDTDSLFVWLGDAFSQQHDTIDVANGAASQIGQALASQLNTWWKKTLADTLNITSRLEIEFETHYYDFLMPTIRNSEKGSKKRYAGRIRKGVDSELVFKGLEAVRTDWTVLAKRFQTALYQKIFDRQTYQSYIVDTVNNVLSGAYDDDLLYQKRLRRDVLNYQKSNPPHIKAAKKYQAHCGEAMHKGDLIAYVITVNGPEPVDYLQSSIDYQHYIDKQLKPIANSILGFLDDDFERIIDTQLRLL
ncbi:DNA polymerase II [Eionea flava]